MPTVSKRQNKSITSISGLNVTPAPAVIPEDPRLAEAEGLNLREYLVPFILGVFVTIFLWLVSLNNFALYHTTVEFTTIAISVAIFLLVWKSRRFIDNNYLLFIGITFVFIAVLDFLHALVYQGIGIFPDGGGILSTRLWIAARYMQAVTLLAAPLFIRTKIRADLVAVVYLAADTGIIASIFIFHTFPATYIPGTGLTPFKIVSEYIISLLLTGSVILLYRNRAAFDRHVLNNLIVAIVLTIAAELTFTEYASFTDIFSLLGHVFRLVSYYFFYRAIVEVGQEKPYNLLWHNLNESEKKYRALSDLSPDAILVIRDGVIRYANEAGVRLSGLSSTDSLIGRNFQDFVHADDRERSVARIAAVQNDHVISPLRELRVLSGETIIPVEVTAGPIPWEGNDAVQVVVRDITRRKKIEEALRTSEEEYRHMVVHAPASIYEISADGLRFCRVNDAMCRILGYTREELMGMSPFSILDEESRARFRERVQKRLEGEEIDESVGYRVLAKDGRIHWVTLNIRQDYAGAGTTLVVAHDITDRKNAEDALHEAHLRTATILEGITDTFYSLDSEWRFTTVNPAAEKAPFGRPAAELLGRVIWELYPALVGTRIQQHYFDAAKKSTLEHYEALSPLNGRWYEVFMQGRSGNVDVYMRDITKRKQAEAALRESEEQARARSDELALLMDSVPAAVWIAHDPDAVHITGNALSYEWLRILPGSEASKSAPAGTRPETFRMFRNGQELGPSEMPVQLAARGNVIRNYEFDFVYPDGSVRNVLGNASPLINRDGYPVGSISSFIDITKRKQVEEELRRRHEDLNAAYEEISTAHEELHKNMEKLSLRETELLKSEANLKDALAEKEILLAEIHHRVKNNLAAFISLLSLEGTYEDTDAGRALKKDLQNRARSMALIHETLYRTGKFSSVDMEIYITTLTGQIAGTYDKGGRIRTIVDARGGVLDLARATTAGLIITELVTNSFKYAFPPDFDCMAVRGEPCTIRVTLSQQDGTWFLTVADNGRGLPENIDPLATKSLGLKLVNFLASHQLRAEIVVRQNKGTEFTFGLNKKKDHI